MRDQLFIFRDLGIYSSHLLSQKAVQLSRKQRDSAAFVMSQRAAMPQP